MHREGRVSNVASATNWLRNVWERSGAPFIGGFGVSAKLGAGAGGIIGS